jgi:alpha-ketoglutarate-dependent 2,4-dichlorophenoxyacetate dioxygenase
MENPVIEPIGRDFASRIHGLDLSRPLTGDDQKKIDDALVRYAVLVVPGIGGSRDEMERFAAIFGRVSNCGDISNVDANDQILLPEASLARQARANMLWHMDSISERSPPLASLLLARELPPSGGETQFADLRAAWNALPIAARLKIDEERASHSLSIIQNRVGNIMDGPSADHPMAITHSRSGQRNLYFSSHTAHPWLDQLIAHATQPEFVYTHHWSLGDIVIWDNQRVLHRVMPYDDQRHRRILWRMEIVG